MQFSNVCRLIGIPALVAVIALAVPVAHADVLVSSFFTDSVLRYDRTTGGSLGAFVAPGSGGLDGPIGLGFGPDGNLYTTSLPGSVLRYSGTTGVFIDTFVAPGSGGLAAPQDLVFGADGNLYVSSGGTGSVLRYSGTTGVFVDTFVPSGSGGLVTPSALIFGPDSNLYVASSFVVGDVLGFGVLRYSVTTGAFIDVFVPSGSGGLGIPTSVVFGPDGDLYVASDLTDSVLHYSGLTGVFIDIFVSSGSGGLDFPTDLVFGPDGGLYVTSFFTDSVLRYSGTTGAFIDVFVSSGSGGLDGPATLTFRARTPGPSTVMPLGIGFGSLVAIHLRKRCSRPRGRRRWRPSAA